MTSGVESARLKIERAAVHIEAIQGAINEYVSRQANLVSKQPNSANKLRFASQPPRDIAILVGEVVYQLRSALDHLAFDLVKSNPSNITLPPRWIEACQFPLLLDIPVTGNPPSPYALPLPYRLFKKNLPGISVKAFAFIEGLQPYYGGNGPTQLRWLAQLSNIDKHRHLHIVVPQAYQTEYIRSPLGNSDIRVRLQNGAELKAALHSDAELADAMYVQRNVADPFISFDESTLDKEATDVSIDNVLEVCADTISAVVIPAFEKLIKCP